MDWGLELAAVFLFCVSTVLILYILAGYPLALARSRPKAAPVRRDPGFRPSVSVLMAVHNGEAFLRGKLESIRGLRYPGGTLDVIVVSDGSTDRTDEIARSFAAQGVRLLRVPRAGKAAALNAGLKLATGDIALFTDARQPLDPDALLHLAANFADPSVGAVTGELNYLESDRTGKQADLSLYWRYELWARGRHSQIDSIFGATGCLYAVRRVLLQEIEADTLSDDVLIPIRVFLAGYRVIFEPAAKVYDRHASTGEFWRKLRTLAGLWQVFRRVPALFTSANRMRFHFLSHKFGRLALPWALLTATASVFAFPASQARTILLSAIAAALALALCDYATPAASRLRRLTSPARTFLEMNAAALLSVAVFFVPPQHLWRPARVEPARGSLRTNAGPELALDGAYDTETESLTGNS